MSVLSALKYGRFQSFIAGVYGLHYERFFFIRPCVRAYILEGSLLSEIQNTTLCASDLSFSPLLLSPVIPSRPLRTWLAGEQASETPPSRDPIREMGD
jgi:hypothetical protein